MKILPPQSTFLRVLKLQGNSIRQGKKERFLLLLFCWFLICSLQAQSSLFDNLITLSDSTSLNQKIELRNNFQNLLEEINLPSARLVLSKKYLEAATASQDSFFLAHSTAQLALISAVASDTFRYHLQGNKLMTRSSIERIQLQENQSFLFKSIKDKEALSFFEKYKTIQSQYGIHTLEFPDNKTKDLYPELQIFKANEGTSSFAEMRKEQHQFKNNNTLTDFDSAATYWVKLKLRGGTHRDTCSFFIENNEHYNSWNDIQAYLVHEDGQVEKQKTGIQLGLEEKPIPLPNNIVRFEIRPHEKATLYVRLEGTQGKRTPAWVSLFGTRNSNYQNSDLYQTDGTFKYSNGFTPFKGNKLNARKIFTDISKQQTIEYIAENWDNLPHDDGYDMDFSAGYSYWTRVRLVGSAALNGTQFFHAAPYPFVGSDGFNFNYIDYYYPDAAEGFVHRRTGYQVPLSERSYYFWANFLKVEVPVNDTLDLFVRLEGGNPRFMMNRLDLFHIDPASVYPNQMEEGIKNGLFYGILAIQFLFFLLLFRIEKAILHLYYAIIVLGVFLCQGFGEDNFRFFVPFPFFRDYHTALFFMGLFLVQVGFLKFTSSYFNIDKRSFTVRFFIPIFLGCSAVANFYAATQFSYSNFTEFPVDKLYYITTILFMLVGIIAAFVIGASAKVKNRTPKLFFILAFLPGLLTGLFFLLRVIIGGFLGSPFASNLFPAFIFTYDALKISMVLMLFLFGLSMGYRTKLFKAEKEKALQQNIKDQKTIIEKLQQADQLKELDAVKTRFFTNITHEFRTPLTVILGMTEQLKNGSWVSKIPSKEKSRLSTGFELIERNGKKLLQLINQLLDFSKLDSGNLKPNYQLREVVSFIQYVGESFESLAMKKGVRLSVYSEIDEFHMLVDEVKLQQIISNLLSNAIKFTPNRGKVVLHLAQKENSLQIKVKDTGEGIPQETLPFIFDRFYQVDNSSSRKGEGTGIGLALVKELVELLEGKIEVKSEVGTGAEFKVLLPIKEVDTKAASNLEAPELSKKRFDKVGLENGATLLPNLEVSVLPIDENKPYLLIAEDNPDVVFYIQSILQPFYNIIIAKDGQEGIDQALEHIPDLIISDVMMPKKDGFELVATLKQDERTSHIPIVLLTAKATQQDKLDGLKFGADAYLMKPFHKEELLIRLENLLEVRRGLQSKYASASNSGMGNQQQLPQSLEAVFLEKVNSILEKKYMDSSLKIQDLAQALDLNYHQLNRKLKALTNQTPTHFIRSFRLQKGKVLLVEKNDLNVSEVAYEVGFESANYFSRAFSEEFGQSPNEARR